MESCGITSQLLSAAESRHLSTIASRHRGQDCSWTAHDEQNPLQHINITYVCTGSLTVTAYSVSTVTKYKKRIRKN